MKQAAVNAGVMLVVVGLFFFIWFVIYAWFYRYANPKLTETELQIWAIMNWWKWILPLGAFGGGCWLILWSRK